jgi:hypothetical protein
VPDPIECLRDHTVTVFLYFDVGSAGGDNLHDNWLNFMRSLKVQAIRKQTFTFDVAAHNGAANVSKANHGHPLFDQHWTDVHRTGMQLHAWSER